MNIRLLANSAALQTAFLVELAALMATQTAFICYCFSLTSSKYFWKRVLRLSTVGSFAASAASSCFLNLVYDIMVQRRGYGRRYFVKGKLTHNQRNERLQWDIDESCTGAFWSISTQFNLLFTLFCILFISISWIEQMDLLDQDNDCVFIV